LAQQHAAAIVEGLDPGEEAARRRRCSFRDYNPREGFLSLFINPFAQLPPFGKLFHGRKDVPPISPNFTLYPFGYGFKFFFIQLFGRKSKPGQVAADGTVALSVRVSNASSVRGDEVVQLYLSHPGIDGAPIRALAGFQRLHLDAGASKNVEFALHDRDLSVVDEAGARRIVTGAVDVWIGGGQQSPARWQPQTKGAHTTSRSPPPQL